MEGELATWEGVDEARNVPGVTGIELYARPGDPVHPHDRSGHKIGMITAAGPSPADVSEALDQATSLLRPIIRPTREAS
ncbi:hypothetical protein ACFWNB_22335 [Kitasatospora purpeofusca]|uniref:hypothetical protein n=1 Tax=Kitasatospora purpeofusca TaxID=67352 RepID=UPI00365C40A5